jgi:hypothetical protein
VKIAALHRHLVVRQTPIVSFEGHRDLLTTPCLAGAANSVLGAVAGRLLADRTAIVVAPEFLGLGFRGPNHQP